MLINSDLSFYCYHLSTYLYVVLMKNSVLFETLYYSSLVLIAYALNPSSNANDEISSGTIESSSIPNLSIHEQLRC